MHLFVPFFMSVIIHKSKNVSFFFFALFLRNLCKTPGMSGIHFTGSITVNRRCTLTLYDVTDVSKGLGMLGTYTVSK